MCGLTHEEVERMMELTENSYRPKAILDVQKAINEHVARAKKLKSRGIINKPLVKKIDDLRLRRNNLYKAWFQGKIE